MLRKVGLVGACPSCGEMRMQVFYKVSGVPVHSVLLMPSQEVARRYAKGEISLGFCQRCGFISNLAFDPMVHEYSARYEETQAFSPTFDLFHRRLATRLIDRYDLRGKTIIEIGCGKGEFLTMLCELGGNSGVGFDPGYVIGRARDSTDAVTFIQDFYSEKYSGYQADFVCCKMTLEHIQNTAEFVGMIRRAIGNRRDVIVFFQVPDVARILQECAFWDIYYEHCSYFGRGSLARLFQTCGFDVISIERDYDDQYLMIEARPGDGADLTASHQRDLYQLRRLVGHFSTEVGRKLDAWRWTIEAMAVNGQRVVLWGGGSKGVAFLTTLEINEEVPYVVDINPHRQGTYMAGTGQEIVGPDFLRRYNPDVVVIMNPVYRREISEQLTAMGLSPMVLAV